MKRITIGGIASRDPSGFSVVELLVVCVVLIALSAMVLSGLSAVVERGRTAVCVAHMKQVGHYILQYSAENNGSLLPALQRTQENGSGVEWFRILSTSQIMPIAQWSQVKGSVMHCPSRTSKNPRPQYHNSLPSADYNGTHYAMTSYPGIGNLIAMDAPKARLAKIERPARTLMLVESNWYYLIYATNNLNRISPHRDGSNLLYFDGHAEFHDGNLPVYDNNVHNIPGMNAPPFF